MDLKDFKQRLTQLNNYIKNLEEIGSLSVLDQAMIKKKVEELYEVVASDYFFRNGISSDETSDFQSAASTVTDKPTADMPEGQPEHASPSEVEDNEQKPSEDKTKPNPDKDAVFYFEDSAESSEDDVKESESTDAEEKTDDTEELTETTDGSDTSFINEQPTDNENNSPSVHSGTSQQRNNFQPSTNGTSETLEEDKPQKSTTEKPRAENSPELDQLFNITYGNDLSDRLSSAPVNDIFKAMGLNERIFTQNELFGGNHVEFKNTIEKLNSLSTFAEAKNYLRSTIAEKFQWADSERKEIASNFIHLVHRRYKNSI